MPPPPPAPPPSQPRDITQRRCLSVPPSALVAGAFCFAFCVAFVFTFSVACFSRGAEIGSAEHSTVAPKLGLPGGGGKGGGSGRQGYPSDGQKLPATSRDVCLDTMRDPLVLSLHIGKLRTAVVVSCLSDGRTEKPLPPVGASLCLVARHSVVSAKATHARYRVGRGSAKTKATRLGLSPLPSTTSTEKLSAHAFHACFLDGVWKRVHPPPDYARVASRKQQIESPANTGQLGELSG